MKTIIVVLLFSATAFAQIYVRQGLTVGPTPNPHITPSVSLSTAGTVNLSASPDWRMWGTTLNALDCIYGPCSGTGKLAGNSISGLYSTGGGDNRFYADTDSPDSFNTFAWSDGRAPASGSLQMGLHSNAGGTVSFSVPADLPAQTLNFWITQKQPGNLTTTYHLSDGSVSDVTIVTPVTMGGDGRAHLLYAVDYAARSNGHFMVVTFSSDSAGVNNNTLWHAATLSRSLITPNTYVPEVSARLPNLQEMVAFAKAADVVSLPAAYTYPGGHVYSGYDGGGGTYIEGGLLTITSGPLTLRGASVNLPDGQRVLKTEPTASITAISGDCGLRIITGAHDVTVDGIEFKTDPGFSGDNYQLVCIQQALFDPLSDISTLPANIKFSHNYIHGRDITYDPVTFTAALHGNNNVGIYIDGNGVTVSDNVIVDFFFDTRETNGVNCRLCNNSMVSNNEVLSIGENIFYFLGSYNPSNPPSPTQSTGVLMPKNGRITRNYIHKDLRYQVPPLVRTKNLIEIKNGHDIRADNNVLYYSFEGVYSEGQHGNCLALGNRQVTGDAINLPSTVTHNIEADHNILRHCGAGISMQAIYDDHWGTGSQLFDDPTVLANALAAGAARSGNFNLHDNYMTDIDGYLWSSTTTAPRYSLNGGGGPNFQPGICFRGTAGDNVTIRNNVCEIPYNVGDVLASGTYLGLAYPSHTVGGNEMVGYHSQSASNGAASGGPAVNRVIDNNIFPADFLYDGLHTMNTTDNVTTFTNNCIHNVVTDWSALSTLNASFPGKWAGNITSGACTSTQGLGTAGLAMLLAGEAAIVAGNR